ncbi:hypothetical protein SPONL_2247 [uncultured Candidatus Thioglobus sp.]|nr:hypothetical protein SPONL_2247 [uncultured Candidatus Thioglobus sp.]
MNEEHNGKAISIASDAIEIAFPTTISGILLMHSVADCFNVRWKNQCLLG